MSETYEVQFTYDGEEWLSIIRSTIGQIEDNNGPTGRFADVTDAFILLGKEMQCDPTVQHRIVRYVQEVVVAPPAKEEGKTND